MRNFSVWTPPESDPLALRGRTDLVLKLAKRITTQPTTDPTLGTGNAGRALLLHYLGSAIGARSILRASEEHLQSAVDAAAEMDLRVDMFRGYLGIAWVVQHLATAAESEQSCADIDAELQRHLRDDTIGNFDAISGLSSIGIYALERIQFTSGRECLALVVNKLAAMSTEESNGLVAWKTVGDQLRPEYKKLHSGDGYYDVGVAHGTAGVIPILAGACAFDVEVRTARRLLEGAVEWIIARRLTAGGFPSFTTTEAIERRSRLAWCYGEAGIAGTLACAADATQNAHWLSVAVDIGRSAALRPANETEVVDASLCHGAAGLAQIFGRLFQRSGDTVIGNAARTHSEHAIQYQDATGRFPYVARDTDGETKMLLTPSFLCGDVGIGLSLLASVCGQAGWDRLLGLSLPSFHQRSA